MTIVAKETIQSFGTHYEVPNADAQDDFKMNVLYDALELAEPIETDDDMVQKNISENIRAELQKQPKVPEVQREARNLSVFLHDEFRDWEKSILRFVDEDLKDVFEDPVQMQAKKLNKTLGEFLQGLFNTVNTSGFFTRLAASIKATLIEGIEQAEAELKIDVGFAPELDQEVQIMTRRQLDGFTVQGTRWEGLRGVSNQVQERVREHVLEGIRERLSLSQVKENIRKTLTQTAGGQIDGEKTQGRAMTIARTETNRIINIGREKAFIASGLPGKKVWDAFLDNRTSDICERLDKQEVDLHERFRDEETGQTFEHPPAHPNCRSVLRFEVEEV